MNWRAHLFFGVLLVVGFFWANYHYNLIELELLELGWLFYVLVGLIIYFYALAPDLDHQISKIRFVVTTLGMFIVLLLLITNQITLGIVFLTGLLILWILPTLPGWEHRGHMHSIVFGIIISLPVLLFLSWKLAAVSFIAFYSHLLADRYLLKIWK